MFAIKLSTIFTKFTKVTKVTKVTSMIGFAICVALPIEGLRLIAISAPTIPLFFFSSGEYIITGENKYTEMYATVLYKDFFLTFFLNDL